MIIFTDLFLFRSIPYEFPAFTVSNNFYSSYAFTSFTPTLIIQNGGTVATIIGCISADITPDLGPTLTAVFGYIPLVILILVGIATAFAGIFSPWGTTDTFRWTTNYGRDADLLRLVTPRIWGLSSIHSIHCSDGRSHSQLSRLLSTRC